jgi:undecaprenyl diphosphate synthase
MHISIIMDGNRRWAESNKTTFRSSYNKGADKLTEIVLEAKKNQIQEISVFAFSTDNLSRSKDEIEIINSILKDYIINRSEILIENEIKLKVVGDRTHFDKETLRRYRELRAKNEKF